MKTLAASEYLNFPRGIEMKLRVKYLLVKKTVSFPVEQQIKRMHPFGGVHTDMYK